MDRDNSRGTENSLRTNTCLERLSLWHTTKRVVEQTVSSQHKFVNTQVQKRNHAFHTAEQPTIRWK